MGEGAVKRKKCFPEGSREASPPFGKQDTGDIRYSEKKKNPHRLLLAGIAIIKERAFQPLM